MIVIESLGQEGGGGGSLVEDVREANMEANMEASLRRVRERAKRRTYYRGTGRNVLRRQISKKRSSWSAENARKTLTDEDLRRIIQSRDEERIQARQAGRAEGRALAVERGLRSDSY